MFGNCRVDGLLQGSEVRGLLRNSGVGFTGLILYGDLASSQ